MADQPNDFLSNFGFGEGGFRIEDLLLALGGFAFGGIPGAVGGFLAPQFFRGTQDANAQAAQLTTDLQANIQETQAQTRADVQGSLFPFTFGGTQFGGVPFDPDSLQPGQAARLPSSQGPALENIFTAGGDALNFLRANQPDLTLGNVDFSSVLDEFTGVSAGLGTIPGAVGDILSNARNRTAGLVSGGQTTPEDLLAGVQLPDTDLSAVQAARLGGVSAASGARESLGLQNLGAQAGGAGGLETARRQASDLSFAEARTRGLAAGNVVAQTRGEELNAQSFVSQLQQLAASQSEDINARLLAQQIQQETQFGGLQGGAALQAGLAQGEVGVGRANVVLQELLTNLGIDTTNLQTRERDFLRELSGVIGAGQDDITAFLTALNQGNVAGGLFAGVGANELGSEGNILQTLAAAGLLSPSLIDPFSAAGLFAEGGLFNPTQPEGPGTQLGFGIPGLAQVGFGI